MTEEGDFDDGGVEVGWKGGLELFEEAGWQIDVVDFARLLIVKMGVGAQIRAIAGGTALVVDLTDQPTLNEGFEAVVDRCE